MGAGNARAVQTPVLPQGRAVWQEDDDRRDADAVRVAGYTGWETRELRELCWRDIDWKGSAVSVSRALSATLAARH